MPTWETILQRTKKIGLPVARESFEKTNKTPVPDPPYIVWLADVRRRGDDHRNRIAEIDATIELYTDRRPDPDLESKMEETVLFDVEYEKQQEKISSEDMVQTAYNFLLIEKCRRGERHG